MSSIYLPGRGMVNLTARRIDKAVTEYDERLFFRRNPQNGQWTVFRKMEHGVEPLPVLGFGFDIPSVDRVLKRLYESDSRRHDLVARINKHNERLKKEQQDKVDDAQEFAAEALEWGANKMKGRIKRIFVPKGV